MDKSLNGKELGRGITQRKDGLYQARFIVTAPPTARAAMARRLKVRSIPTMPQTRWWRQGSTTGSTTRM